MSAMILARSPSLRTPTCKQPCTCEVRSLTRAPHFMSDLNFKCANCTMQLLEHKAVDMSDAKPQIGDLLVCGNCGMPNIVTLTGAIIVPDEVMNALTKEERDDLLFAQRAIKRNLRNDQ